MRIVFAALLIAGLSAGLAHAQVSLGQKRNGNQPIDINSDTLEVLQDKQLAIFRGKVDAVLHVRASTVDPVETDAIVSRARDEVISGAQSRYGPAAPLVHVHRLLAQNADSLLGGREVAKRFGVQVESRIDQEHASWCERLERAQLANQVGFGECSLRGAGLAPLAEGAGHRAAAEGFDMSACSRRKQTHLQW